MRHRFPWPSLEKAPVLCRDADERCADAHKASRIKERVGSVPAGGTWVMGGHSLSGSGNRTLEGFSTSAQSKMYDDCPGCPYKHYEMFYDYYGDFDYADKWVSAALSNGKADFTKLGDADFGARARRGRI